MWMDFSIFRRAAAARAGEPGRAMTTKDTLIFSLEAT
jgi:hypothetical protein